MAFLTDFLSVDNITTLKALNSTSTPKRVDKFFLSVLNNGTGVASWYNYDSTSSTTENLPSIITPNDNVGRWFQYSAGGGAGGGVNFGGQSICTTQCVIAAGGSGKAFEFYAAQTAIPLIVVPSFGINIQAGSTAIAIYRWSQLPNTTMTGRETAPIVTTPNTGGNISLTITSTFKWISVFAKNPANSNFLDGTCFVVNGNVITLLGYS